jgi:hypothetical protein
LVTDAGVDEATRGWLAEAKVTVVVAEPAG